MGFNGNKAKINLLGKKVLQAPKCKGGLGIRNMGLFNKALLSKQVWRVLDKKDSILRKWIWHNYVYDKHNFLFRETTLISPVWKSIDGCKDIVSNNLEWKVRNGRDIWLYNNRFWKQPYQDNPGFLHVLNLLVQGKGEWDQSKLMVVYSQNSIQQITNSIPLAIGIKDNLVWKVNPQGIYKVKGANNLMLSHENDLINASLSWEDFWKLNLPPKYFTFTWRLVNRAIPCNVMLKDHHWDVKHVCPFGAKQEESMDHIFINCDFARSLWFAMDV